MLRNQQGYWWHQGALGAPRGCRGVRRSIRGVEGVRDALGAGRECRYSGASRGIGSIRGHWRAPTGCRGLERCWTVIRGCKRCQGCIRDSWWTGSPTTLGPNLGSQHSHWFPLGSDPPGQGQASDRNELCRLLYTFGTIFSESLHFCIYAALSNILTHNVKKCYMDYVLSRPIYTYPYTINLMYYDTMVLITKNYFSHQTSELGTSNCKCQGDLM